MDHLSPNNYAPALAIPVRIRHLLCVPQSYLPHVLRLAEAVVDSLLRWFWIESVPDGVKHEDEKTCSSNAAECDDGWVKSCLAAAGRHSCCWLIWIVIVAGLVFRYVRVGQVCRRVDVFDALNERLNEVNERLVWKLQKHSCREQRLQVDYTYLSTTLAIR